MIRLYWLLCLVLFGCQPLENTRQQDLKRWLEPNGKIKVLCTIAMITDLVEQIGADEVDCITLIAPGLDPHSYQLVKGDDEKLLAADVIFFNGLGLEHGPSLKNHLLQSKHAVSFGDHLLEDPGAVYNVDGLPDPHIWMDIVLWSQGIDPIVATLSKERPEKKEEFTQKGELLREKMLQEHKLIQKLVRSLPPEKRYIVTSHDAFHYFARGYLATDQEQKEDLWQKRCEAPEGLAPESMLSITDIQDVISHLERYQIPVIFAEASISQDSVYKIVAAAKEKGLRIRLADCLLYSDSMGVAGSDADTYLNMMRHNAECIVDELKKGVE